jgi:hypothetical protein
LFAAHVADNLGRMTLPPVFSAAHRAFLADSYRDPQAQPPEVTTQLNAKFGTRFDVAQVRCWLNTQRPKPRPSIDARHPVFAEPRERSKAPLAVAALPCESIETPREATAAAAVGPEEAVEASRPVAEAPLPDASAMSAAVAAGAPVAASAPAAAGPASVVGAALGAPPARDPRKALERWVARSEAAADRMFDLLDGADDVRTMSSAASTVASLIRTYRSCAGIDGPDTPGVPTFNFNFANEVPRKAGDDGEPAAGGGDGHGGDAAAAE